MVYWVMDLYPRSPGRLWGDARRHFQHQIFEAINPILFGKADAVVALGRCMRDRILAKGIDKDQVQIIGVWTDSEEVKPIPREENQYEKMGN